MVYLCGMEITSAEYRVSSATYKQCPPADRPEYAFIGRSNVGKSSLINMLTGRRHLAKTSATPGKTQLLNHFEIVSDNKQKWFLVDLPGYGYARASREKVKAWTGLVDSYLAGRANLARVFVLIDSRHGLKDVDGEALDRLDKGAVSYAIVLTKVDELKPPAVAEMAGKTLAGISRRPAAFPAAARPWRGPGARHRGRRRSSAT